MPLWFATFVDFCRGHLIFNNIIELDNDITVFSRARNFCYFLLDLRYSTNKAALKESVL